MNDSNRSSRYAKNDRREIFGWLMYDWANSAFYTTVISVLLAPYLTSLAQTQVGENGIVWSFGFLGSVTAKSLFHFCLTVSVFLQVLLLPILGAVSDYSNLKKRLMAFFCYLGVAASCLLFFVTENFIVGNILMIAANLSFGAANVFYNAYLVDITTEDKRDKISSYGFAAGYAGGVIMLILNLLLVNNAAWFGLTQGSAVRISFLLASIWWGAFSLVTFFLVKTRGGIKKKPAGKNYVSIGFSELLGTFKLLLAIPNTAKFLVAYFCYNNGIQTVISSASVFLAQELFVAKGQKEDQGFLLGVFLVAQISALIGSVLFERLSRYTGTKAALMISLIGWVGVVIYGYQFLDTTFQAWGLGVAIGLVLGSSQALSRSLFSQMIPEGKESSFFGLYEISERGTTLIGSGVFSIVVAATGSYRQAILSLIFFLIIGIIILFFTDIKRAIKESGKVEEPHFYQG